MSDQRDDLDSLDDLDTLPPDLEDVHRLLLRDGARWRVRLPDSASHTPIEQRDARVDRRVGTPTVGSPGTRGSQSIQQNVRKEAFMRDTTQIDDGPRPPAILPTPAVSRFRSIAAVGAAVAIVALFAGLIYTFGPGRTTAGNSVKPATHTPATATTARNDSGWSAVVSLRQQPAVPIFASDGATVYEAAPTVLRRSDDGGKSWHTLTLPADSGANAADVSILVSPLDARKVILQVTGYQAQGVTTCPTAFAPSGHGSAVASSGAVPLSSTIPLGGSITCTVQYYSADGGQHWTHLHAPSGAVLGNKNPQASVPGTPSAPLFAQGSSLYTYAGCGPLCMGPGLRIVRSTDSGATWSYADDALASQSAHVCSFMPAPSGSTVFALTNSSGCQTEGVSPDFALWSSADAGAHWSQATLPAGSQTPQSVLVVSHGSGQPLLYLNLQAPPQPHIGGTTSTPADLRVSGDGGQHWSAAPASGVPAGSTSTLGLLGALSDGTVVELFASPDSTRGPATGLPLYGWKQGDAAWHPIALGKPITENFVSLSIVPGVSGEQDQLWLVAAENATQGAFTYNVSVLTAGG